jgi:hypothetical protein
MEHINDIEFMEFISGRLTSIRNDEVKKHIAACKKCLDHQQELMQLWNKLGQWDVSAAGHDISSRVIADVKKTQYRQKLQPHIVKSDFWVDILRVAALIVIAVGIGQKLGTISTGQKEVPSVLSQVEPKYIASFGLEWSSELTWLMMEDETSSQEQQL